LEEVDTLQLQELANIPEAFRGLQQAAALLLLDCAEKLGKKKTVKACSDPIPTQSGQSGTDAVEDPPERQNNTCKELAQTHRRLSKPT
jgi:hypothetical protein